MMRNQRAFTHHAPRITHHAPRTTHQTSPHEIPKTLNFYSNSQFNQKCVMLRACAELAEASSEASRSALMTNT
ncbi:MAG: hypothetical protein WBP47_16795, partial [Candidatus Promineifilaceae bacterium]